MTKKALVAVCDILGFSNLITHESLDRIINYHTPNLKTIYKGSIPDIEEDSKTENEDKVGFAIFSDTILIYSLSDDKNGYHAVINTVLRLVAQYILHPDYRMRVGIDYGEFYAEPEHNIYIGKALIEAHNLEKRQEWCGATFTKMAEDRLDEISLKHYYLEFYDVPIKPNKDNYIKNSKRHLIIDWTLSNHDLIDQEYRWLAKNDLYNSLSDEQKKRIDTKLENTEKFHTDRCVQCEMHRKHKK